MTHSYSRAVAFLVAVTLALPPPVFAQAAKPVPAEQAEDSQFNVEQLDALFAPIALEDRAGREGMCGEYLRGSASRFVPSGC
jgi:hypothetical protein